MKASKARGVARLDRISAVLGAALRAGNCGLTAREGWGFEAWYVTVNIWCLTILQ
jgi:hypothetical protein